MNWGIEPCEGKQHLEECVYVESLTISGRSGFTYPISQMPNKIEKEISFWNTYHFVSNLNKQTEPFSRLQVQSLCNVKTKIFGSSTGINFESLKNKVREERLTRKNFLRHRNHQGNKLYGIFESFCVVSLQLPQGVVDTCVDHFWQHKQISGIQNVLDKV